MLDTSDTIATQELQERRECYTSDTSATRVGNFDFDKDTSKIIFSHPYISYTQQMKDGKNRNNFILRTAFWKCLSRMPKCIWKVHHKNYHKNYWVITMLDSFRNFAYVCSYLHLKSFAWRLCNIFKTTNVMKLNTKLNKVIIKSSYGVLQESPYLMSCMIFEENYFSGYILLISLPGYLKADIEQYICCNC